MKSVAVVTDAMSSAFFFPIWHSYYGGLFGFSNLHVATYDGHEGDFRSFELGALWKIPSSYKDGLRARVLSSWTAALLEAYDVVVRCDVDEFLLADKRKYASLYDLVQTESVPYITARGIDLVEDVADKPLDFSKPIVGVQRKLCIRSSALNKTAVVSTPMKWADGFHCSTVFPRFAHVFLLHMKFADVAGRIAWFNLMLSQADQGSREFAYFSDASEKLKRHREWCCSKARAGSEKMYDEDFDTHFVASVGYHSGTKIYQGSFSISDDAFSIPSEYDEVT